MSYTIVGMFPSDTDVEKAVNQLEQSGFAKEDYHMSRYSTSGDYEKNSSAYQFEEDEKTSGFWNWLFGEDEDQKNKYSFAGSKSNLLTVYANDITEAEKAREIMNNQGAIDIDEFTKERYENLNTPSESQDLSEQKRARIISKAKNNLYFTDDQRFYTVRNQGMENDMDSLGNKD